MDEQTGLSSCVLDVLQEIVDGSSSDSKEIASRLGISPGAVDQRLCVAMRVLGVGTRTDAAIEALRRGLVRGYRLVHAETPADGDTGSTD